MGCFCGLVGSLIIDVGSAERRSNPQPRPGPSAVFSIDVTAADATDPLNIIIWHKNSGDTTWANAGSFSSITTTGVFTKYITALKELLYWELKCTNGKFVVNAMNAQGLPG